MNKKQLEKCTILKVISGSVAYGFNTKESDIDYRGISIPPKEYFLTPEKRFDQYLTIDCTIYNIMKFFKLSMNNNPNILELLWIDKPEHIIYLDKYAKKLKSIRKEFLSTKVKFTYSGYAFSQLKRIKSHKKWLLEPPTHKPIRSEFDLDELDTINCSDRGALNKLIERKYTFDSNIIKYIQKENKFQQATKQWNQYCKWKNNRNPKRAKLELKYGYDTKHATHLVRLMRQGLEILKTGELSVYRQDAKELLSIREGEWSFDKLIDYTTQLEVDMTNLYNNPKKCAVPKNCNREKLGNICMEMLETYWKDKEKMNFFEKICSSLDLFKDTVDFRFLIK